VGHCVFQKYATAAWVIVQPAGAASAGCTPTGGAIVVCACGRMKAKQIWVVPVHVCVRG
jgi:hypothetical protein